MGSEYVEGCLAERCLDLVHPFFVPGNSIVPSLVFTLCIKFLDASLDLTAKGPFTRRFQELPHVASQSFVCMCVTRMKKCLNIVIVLTNIERKLY